MPLMETVIRVKDAAKIYRRSHLGRTIESVGIDGLSLEVPSGEVFGLLGLNGSGKTTTIKLLLGLLRATRGRVELFGHGMPDLDALTSVGYLPEAACFERSLTGLTVPPTATLLRNSPAGAVRSVAAMI